MLRASVMATLLHILLRTLSGIAGTLLLYVAFFLYEDEEARIQNRLEETWKRIDVLHSRALSKEVAFLHGVTKTTSALLDIIFGYKLLSIQSVAVSMAFSVISLTVGLDVTIRPAQTPDILACLGCTLLLLALASIPAFVPSLRTLHPTSWTKSYYVGLMIVAAVCIWLEWFIVFPPNEDSLLPSHPLADAFQVLLMTILPGVVIDIVFIAFFRWVLKKVSTLNGLGPIMVYLIAVTAFAASLIAPAFWVDSVTWFLRVFARLDYSWAESVSAGLAVIALTNLIDVLCLLLLVTIMVALLVHRLSWPFMKRSIYAANRRGLVKNTKLLGTLGTMLLLYAFPNNAIIKWITHFLPNLKGG
jgi:hypothetical protein